MNTAWDRRFTGSFSLLCHSVIGSWTRCALPSMLAPRFLSSQWGRHLGRGLRPCARPVVRHPSHDRRRAALSPTRAKAEETAPGSLLEGDTATPAAEEEWRDWDLQQSGARLAWLRPDVNLVLVHPQIPHNTGCTSRTCAACGVGLHLVGPLGFELDSRRLKRAGCDYWPFVSVRVHTDWEAFLAFFGAQPGPRRLLGFTKRGDVPHSRPGLYRRGDWLLFGSEVTGLLPEMLDEIERQGGHRVQIPMRERHVRSINLSVAAGVGLYEAIRQLDEASPEPREE